jgi:multiple sugar transport system ATP-binding protein
LAGISLVNVWKKYGTVEAVKGISLNCPPGQFFCLLGPSGAGKTSILKMIAGVEEVSAGEIYIDDRLINDVRPQERDIAMMFENYALYPHLTVFKNMAAPYVSSMRKAKHSSKEVEEIVRQAAKLLSIEELLNRYPKQLSGGQKQRVALGRALVRKPVAFLLDEPISHLDAKLRHSMRTELKKIHEEAGVTFIYATPDQLEAISMADVIAVINKGEVQQIGNPEEIFESPRNEFVAGFVGDPPMNLFDCAVQRINGTLLLRNADFSLPLSGELSKRLSSTTLPEEVRVGIRPTNISMETEKRNENDISAKISVLEPLGRYTIVTVVVNRMFFKIKAGGYLRLAEGQAVWLGLDQNKLHLFDRKTGQAVI